MNTEDLRQPDNREYPPTHATYGAPSDPASRAAPDPTQPPQGLREAVEREIALADLPVDFTCGQAKKLRDRILATIAPFCAQAPTPETGTATCFWPNGCSDRKRCYDFNGCVADAQNKAARLSRENPMIDAADAAGRLASNPQAEIDTLRLIKLTLERELAAKDAELAKEEQANLDHAEDWAFCGLSKESIAAQGLVLRDENRKLRAQLAAAREDSELLDALESMAGQHCHTRRVENDYNGQVAGTDVTDSGAMSSDAEALRILAAANPPRFRIVAEHGRMVVGYWPGNDPLRAAKSAGEKGGKP